MKRRTLLHQPIGIYDPQQLPPLGWCAECGAEIYAPGQELCQRCLDRKEETQWETLNLANRNTSTV